MIMRFPGFNDALFEVKGLTNVEYDNVDNFGGATLHQGRR